MTKKTGNQQNVLFNVSRFTPVNSKFKLNLMKDLEKYKSGALCFSQDKTKKINPETYLIISVF